MIKYQDPNVPACLQIGKAPGCCRPDSVAYPGGRTQAACSAVNSRRFQPGKHCPGRLAISRRKHRPKQHGLISEIISMLTSFETYDALSRAGHDDPEIVRMLLTLVQASIAAK